MRAKHKNSLIALMAILLVLFWNGRVRSETTTSQICVPTNSPHSEVSHDNPMAYLKTKSAHAGQVLKDSITSMRSAKKEIECFVDRKASQKTKSYSWYIAEIATNGNEIVVMRVDFYGEKGPVSFATKRVYQDEKRSKEKKEKGYVLYFYENGNVKMFQTRGTPETIVQFYPTGKIKELGVVDGDRTLTEIRCGENNEVEYEKCEEGAPSP